MPKGKRGPRPEVNDDRTAEEIVGRDNVVDVGMPIEQQPPERQGYKCSQPGCPFQTGFLTEMEEHVNGTGHGSYVTDTIDPQQPELFSTPGIVHKQIQVQMDEEFLVEKRARLAALYQEALDVREAKKSADDDFNAQLKTLDTDMQAIARVLRTPFTYDTVDCEWRIIEDENARGLYRLDTGELLETQPLSEEDRVRELQKAQADNAERVVAKAGV